MQKMTIWAVKMCIKLIISKNAIATNKYFDMVALCIKSEILPEEILMIFYSEDNISF